MPHTWEFFSLVLLHSSVCLRSFPTAFPDSGDHQEYSSLFYSQGNGNSERCNHLPWVSGSVGGVGGSGAIGASQPAPQTQHRATPNGSLTVVFGDCSGVNTPMMATYRLQWYQPPPAAPRPAPQLLTSLQNLTVGETL